MDGIFQRLLVNVFLDGLDDFPPVKERTQQLSVSAHRRPPTSNSPPEPSYLHKFAMQTNVLTLFVGLALSAFLVPASATPLSTSSGSLKTLPYNFTLAALNTTLPNANDTGVPLVLGYDCMASSSERKFACTDLQLDYVHGSSGFTTSVSRRPRCATESPANRALDVGIRACRLLPQSRAGQWRRTRLWRGRLVVRAFVLSSV